MSQSTNTKQSSSSAKEEPRYFNVYANGLGYLNSFREIGSQGHHAVQVAAIQGPSDSVHYEYLDLVVTSDVVRDVLTEHQAAIESEDTKVLVRFNMANPRAKAFIFQKGKRAGEAGAVIGGFLTRILSMKIDGELVYEDDRAFDDQAEPAQVANG